MVKNYLKLALIIVLIANICGCAELRKKFVRKKKPRKEEVSFYRVQEYKPRPPHERYQDHYVLWHNWQLDLERMEGTSHLRDIRSLNESLRHLTAMRDLLEDEKAKGLDIQIKYTEGLREKLKKTKKDIAKDPHSRKLIERIGRIVVNNFSYNRMKDYIKSDNSEMGVEESEEE